MKQKPWLWLVAQLIFGGTYDKRKLAVKYYNGERRVLEIGCAVGNVSRAFVKFRDITFVGVDIDADAIDVANFCFRKYPSFAFIAGPAEDLIGREELFDFVLLAGVLHHVPDDEAVALIGTAAKLLSPGGTLVISEPEPPRSHDSWIVRTYGRIERGAWLREVNDLIALAHRHPSLDVIEVTESFITPFIMNWPSCFRFALIKLKPQFPSSEN